MGQSNAQEVEVRATNDRRGAEGEKEIVEDVSGKLRDEDGANKVLAPETTAGTPGHCGGVVDGIKSHNDTCGNDSRPEYSSNDGISPQCGSAKGNSNNLEKLGTLSGTGRSLSDGRGILSGNKGHFNGRGSVFENDNSGSNSSCNNSNNSNNSNKNNCLAGRIDPASEKVSNIRGKNVSVSGNGSLSDRHGSLSGNKRRFSKRGSAGENNGGLSGRSGSIGGISLYSSSDGTNGRGSADPLLLLPSPSCAAKLLSWRYAMVLLVHLSFVVTILERNCMPIAMVCMTNPSPDGATGVEDQRPQEEQHQLHLRQELGLNVSDMSDMYFRNQTTKTVYEYEFDWHAEVQGLVLTAVSFSSFLCPLMVDFVRPLLGNKATLTLMTMLASTLTFLTPVAARTSPWLLFTVRLVIGTFFGGTVTIMGDSFAWWAPVLERQTMTALAFAGVNVGGIVTSAVTGYLCLVPWDRGWPFIFYVFGSLGTVWSITWCVMSSQKPETHPFISTSEKTYIVNSRIAMEEIPGKRRKPPYRTILTSRPVLAFVTSVVCNSWTTNVYFTYLPAFFVTALGFTVQQAGVILSVVSAIRFMGHICWTSLSNLMLHKSNMETTWARKIAICVGFGLAGASQCCIIFVEERHTWPVIGLLGVVMFNVSVGSCVATVLPLEMAPRYSGFLSGLAHSVGGLVSISGPLIVGVLTPHGTMDEWKTVWIIVTVVFFISAFIFLTLGDASLQAWGRPSCDSNSPTVVSAFVAMGRRFSVVMNSSPLTPALAHAYTRPLGSLNSLPLNNAVSLAPNAHDEGDEGVQQRDKYNPGSKRSRY